MTAPVPLPTVVGPIVGPNPPWGAPGSTSPRTATWSRSSGSTAPLRGHQLRDGTEATVDGRWEVEPYGEAPYRTRLLVVRPEHADRFNGTVVVHWQNVSAGYENRHRPTARSSRATRGWA